jgi:carboxypeptidase C (cathepsin A)
MILRCACLSLVLCVVSSAMAQAPPVTPTPPTEKADDADWVRTTASAVIAGQTVNYQTTVGLMPIRNARGETEGRMFFTAYRRTNGQPGKKRPLTFVFNGGPGSASLWLHLGFVGPKRVKMEPDGFMPPPPYELVPNDESILPETDLVLIDPIGTGFSRPEKPELGKKFWGVQEDISSVGEFIRKYLTQEQRWLSPIFVMGESYGGIRGSGLAQWLGDNGVGLNGLILISPYMNGSVQDPAKANDQPFAFYLPTYAAAAWYHKKLDADMEEKPVGELVKEVQAWVYDEYLPALMRGGSLDPAKRKSIVAKLHRYTGLSETFLQDTNLRIDDGNWYKELLRTDRYTVGRYDARYKGIDRVWATDHPDYDPSYSQVEAPFTSTMNDYVRGELGYKTNAKYFVLGEGIWEPWNMGNGTVDESEALRSALHQNPYTKLFVASGYYDLACPLGTVDQILNQLELDPRLKGNVSRGYYAAGHMMYLEQQSRRQLHADVAKFIESASNPTAPAGTIR